jgi:hypothetical protein
MSHQQSKQVNRLSLLSPRAVLRYSEYPLRFCLRFTVFNRYFELLLLIILRL